MVTDFPRKRAAARTTSVLLPALVSLLTLSGGARATVITNGSCVQALGGQSCTANDVTFVLVGLGTIDDGCTSPSDTITLRLGARLSNGTAQTRYDVGLFINNDGDPATDAYNGASCAIEALHPAGATTATACGPDATTELDLARLFPIGSPDNGPYLNADGDFCADLTSGEAFPGCGEESVIEFTDPVTLLCTDLPPGLPDGFVDIPVCATWGNSADQVGGPSCDNEAELAPGTGSKCRCELKNSTVPVPALGMTCSCTKVSETEWDCGVTVANAASCTPDCLTPEHERCGAAAYYEYQTDYDPAQVTISNISGSGSTLVANDTLGGLLRWQPVSAVDPTCGGGGTQALMIPGQTSSFSYRMTLVGPADGTATIVNDTTAIFSNDPVFAGSPDLVAAGLATSCRFLNAPNWANVSQPRAFRDRGRVVVEWETGAEVETLAWGLERQDPRTRAWTAVAAQPLPASGSLPGGSYRFVDAAAPPAERLIYRLVELEASGRSRVHGPWELAVEARRATAVPAASGVRAKPRLRRAETAADTARWAPPVRARIATVESGWHSVPAGDLATALGVRASTVANWLRRGELRLTHFGHDVAWSSDRDGNSLDFHAEPFASPYADTNAYWVAPGKGTAVVELPARPVTTAVSAAASFRDRASLEQDVQEWLHGPRDPEGDYWFWSVLIADLAGQARRDFDFQLAAPAGDDRAGAAGELAVRLHGYAPSTTSGRFRVTVDFNGSRLGEAVWSAALPETARFPMPAGLLAEGENRITLTATEGSVWVDGFDLDYARRYRAADDRLAFRGDGHPVVTVSGFSSPEITLLDLSEPRLPRRVTGAAAGRARDGSWQVRFRPASPTTPYFASAAPYAAAEVAGKPAPAGLRDAANRADYLVITDAALVEAAQELADYRAGQGFETRVVTVEQITDEFRFGVFDRAGLTEFLRWAATRWALAPRYVVLAGKGSYDYRGLHGDTANLVPAMVAATGLGLVGSDLPLADFVGRDGDPEVAIGRLPVLSADELRAFVAKLRAYESAPAGSWSSRVALVADDADAAGDFPATSLRLRDRIPAGFDVETIHLASPADAAAARARLLTAFGEGAALINFVGHGGLDRLAHEVLLASDDVPALANGARLPVFTAESCYVASFAFPGFRTLAEELVLAPQGGAIAAWGPGGLSFEGEVAELADRILPALLDSGSGRLGDRAVAGLRAYLAAGGKARVAAAYTLLGDPATDLR